EQQVGEYRSQVGSEAPSAGVVHHGADEIGGEQVWRALHAMKRSVDRVGERFDGQGLGEARDALDEEVAATEQAKQQPSDKVLLANDNFALLGEDGLEELLMLNERVDGHS